MARALQIAEWGAQAAGLAAAVVAHPQIPEGPAHLLGRAIGQQLAIDFVKANPDWRLSLQSHKLLGLR